jgi:hypothetical protein
VHHSPVLGDGIPRQRLSEVVSAAAYGCVLLLAALAAIGVSEIADGQGLEIIAGVGGATWLAHLFAELLGGHLRSPEPLHRHEVARAAIDGSPILVSTILPAVALALGRVGVLEDATARYVAIGLGVAQLAAIGAYVSRTSDVRHAGRWAFAGITAAAGLAVVLLSVLLGH